MANKYDLKTWMIKTAASGTLTNIGGTIDSGKTRFLTYLKVEKSDPVGSGCGSTIEVLIASQTAATTPTAAVVSAGAKLPIRIARASAATTVGNYPHNVMREMPDSPSLEHPLMSVTGSGWMSLIVRSGPAMCVFATYYDE